MLNIWKELLIKLNSMIPRRNKVNLEKEVPRGKQKGELIRTVNNKKPVPSLSFDKISDKITSVQLH